jgi:hypothetical protein
VAGDMLAARQDGRTLVASFATVLVNVGVSSGASQLLSTDTSARLAAMLQRPESGQAGE